MSTFGRFIYGVALILVTIFLVACGSTPQALVTPGVPLTGETTSTGSGPISSTAIAVSTSVPGPIPTLESTPTSISSVVAPNNLIVTRDNNGQTIPISVGQTFLLNLGEQYRWSVTVSDESVLSREVNILVIRGAQGIYKANKPGQATLSAVGDPACRDQKPPCMLPSVTFEVTIVVQ